MGQVERHGVSPGMGVDTRTVVRPGCDMAGGWYFDDPIAPSVIMLCPEFCQQIKQDIGSKVTMFLECQ